MTYKQLNNLRLQSISKITDIVGDSIITEQLPAKKGLAIEFSEDGETYIVIAWIRYDEEVGECYFESVVDRVQEYVKFEGYNDFKELLKEGFTIVKESN